MDAPAKRESFIPRRTFQAIEISASLAVCTIALIQVVVPSGIESPHVASWIRAGPDLTWWPSHA
jgi:hypothetical protein